MIKSNTNHIGFEDTTCPMGVEAVLVHVVHAGIAIGPGALRILNHPYAETVIRTSSRCQGSPRPRSRGASPARARETFKRAVGACRASRRVRQLAQEIFKSEKI